MTIKDIEQMRNRIVGDIEFYIEVEEHGSPKLIYYKSFDNLLKYVKENYNNDLTHKQKENNKILSVKIWRN